MTAREFSVYQFFPDGSYEAIVRDADIETAVMTARSYTQPHRPAVLMGVIDRVIITDGGDCCCFEWRNGQGIVFPVATSPAMPEEPGSTA